MRRQTTTKQISEAINNNLLQVTGAECLHKTTYERDVISSAIFTENLQFLSESGSLANCVGWYYEKNYKADREYVIETGREAGSSDCIVIAHLHVGDGVSDKDVEKALAKQEGED